MVYPVQGKGEMATATAVRSGGRGLLPIVVIGAFAFIFAQFILTVVSLPPQLVPLLLVAALIGCAAVVIGHTRKLLLATILLGIPFSINVNLFYRDEIAAMNAIAGLYVSVSTMALVGLYGLWFLDAIATKSRGARLLPLLRTDVALMAYVGVVVLSALLANDMKLGFFEVAQLGQFVMLYIYLRHTVRDRQGIKFVVSLLLVGVIIEALIMFALPIIGDDITVASIRARIDGNGRVGGTVGGPNGAGGYMTLMIAPALGLFLSRVRPGLRFIGFVTMVLGIAALILTLSRGGWMGFGVSALIFSFFAIRQRWLPPVTIVGLFVAAAVILIIFAEPVMTRLTSPDEGAAYARWPLMKIAAGMIADQPFLGVGANNSALYVQDYATGPLAAEWLSVVHNRYLLVWAESGIFALIAYLGFLAVTIRRGWRSFHQRDPSLSPLALGMMAAVCGFMVHMTVDIFNSGPTTELFFVVAALLACIDTILRNEAWEETQVVEIDSVATDVVDWGVPPERADATLL